MLLRIEKYLVLAFAVFLPSQLAWHWWPTWSLVSGLRIDYLSPALYFTDLLVVAIIFFSVFQKQINFKIWHLLILVFAGINIAFAQIPQLAIVGWARIFELILLGQYFYNRFKIVRTPLVAGLVVSLIWVSVLALWQFGSQSSINGIWYFLGERRFNVATPGIAKLSLGNLGFVLRSYGTLPHPNALAGFLVIGLGLVDYLDKHIIRKNNFLIIVVGLAILSTWSRLGILVGMAMLLLFTKQRKILWTLLVAPFLLPGNPMSLPERAVLNSLAVKEFLTSPVVGVGVNNFIPKLTAIFQPVHNIYLLILSETGLAGLLIVITLIVNNLKSLWQAHDFQLLVLLMGVLIIGLGDHYWLTLHQNVLLLTVLLATVALKSKTA